MYLRTSRSFVEENGAESPLRISRGKRSPCKRGMKLKGTGTGSLFPLIDGPGRAKCCSKTRSRFRMHYQQGAEVVNTRRDSEEKQEKSTGEKESIKGADTAERIYQSLRVHTRLPRKNSRNLNAHYRKALASENFQPSKLSRKNRPPPRATCLRILIVLNARSRANGS